MPITLHRNIIYESLFLCKRIQKVNEGAMIKAPYLPCKLQSDSCRLLFVLWWRKHAVLLLALFLCLKIQNLSLSVSPMMAEAI